MKLKLGLFSLLLVFVLLFSTCDFLDENGNDNGNETCVHAWEWVTTKLATENEDGSRTEYCSKCKVSGRTQTITWGDLPPDIDDDLLPGVPNPNAKVEPLLKTKWHQVSPYNDLFPYMPEHERAGATGRLLTNCDNTAMVQIIAFHQRPVTATGTSTVIDPYGINVPLVNFENYPFDWVNMRNTYTRSNPGTEQERKAVAELMFIYAMSRNSVSIYSALVENFGYDKTIQRHRRRFYTDAEWEAIIKQQLDDGLPVFYSAGREGGGHAFVIDGYDSSGKFHVNWGWNGRDDGWYSLNALTPGTVHYDRDHSAVINIKTDAGGVGSNVFRLSSFTTSSTSVSQNEPFTVTANLGSSGFFTGGQVGVVLVGNGGGIAHVVGTRDRGAVNPERGWGALAINCFIPETVNADKYNLQIATRLTDGEWKIITASDREANIPNTILFNVTAGEINGGGYGQVLTSFTTSQYSVSQGEQFTVTFATRNMSSDIYPGGLQGVALVDQNNNIIVKRSVSRSALNPGSTRVLTTINCTVPNTVLPGAYSLRIVINKIDNEEWRIATTSTSSDIPTSFDFEVK